MNREDIAWVAGLFEGEGSIGAYVRTGKPNCPQPILRIYSSDVDVLEHAQQVLGLGQVALRPKARWVTKPAYALTIYSWERVQAVAAMVWPWLGERRKEQVRKTLNARSPG